MLSDYGSTNADQVHKLSCVLILLIGLIAGCSRDSRSDQNANAQTSPRPTEQVESVSAVESTPKETQSTPNLPQTDQPEPRVNDTNSIDASSQAFLKPTPAQLQEATLKALGRGDDDLAFRLARELRSVAPDDPQSVFLNAMVLAERHRFFEAIRLVDSLAAKNPAVRLPALGKTAEWLVLTRQFDKAESRYRTVAESPASSPAVFRHLSHLLVQTGKPTEALSLFHALAQYGELNQKELRFLLSIGTPLVASDPASQFLPLNDLAKAREKCSTKQFDEAKTILQSIASPNSQSKALLARIHATQDDYSAVKSWASSGSADRKIADSWYALGMVASNKNQNERAVECFSRAIMIDQTDAQAYESFSESLLAIGKTDFAKKATERATLIRKSQEIGSGLKTGKDADRKKISQIVSILEKLDRHLEAFGWQNVDMAYAVADGSMDDSIAETSFNLISQQREQLVKSGRDRPNPAIILCGYELKSTDQELLDQE